MNAPMTKKRLAEIRAKVNDGSLCRERVFDFEAEQLIDEIDRLRAIVDKLPKTADGVAMVPGDAIWVITDDMGIQADLVDEPRAEKYNAHLVSDCFSTEAAARAAKEA